MSIDIKEFFRGADINKGSKIEVILNQNVEYFHDARRDYPIEDGGFDISPKMAEGPGRKFIGFLVNFDEKEGRLHFSSMWNYKKDSPDYTMGGWYVHKDAIFHASKSMHFF